MLKILCVDPGTTRSGVCVLSGDYPTEVLHEENKALLQRIERGGYDILLCEKVAGGNRAGEALLRTVWWTGVFCYACARNGGVYNQMPRSSVKRVLRAKDQIQVKSADSKVRAALLEFYEDSPEVKKMLAGGGGHGLQACAMGIAYRINEGLCEL